MNGDGSFAGFIGSAIDITDQKLAQAALDNVSARLIEAQEKERSSEGRSPKEIASILDISIRTVFFHKYEIMKELGIANNAELVQYAIKHSLIPPP